MEYRKRARFFPGMLIGLFLLLIGGAMVLHLFFPFYLGGYYAWHPFLPWGGFFFGRSILLLFILLLIARRIFRGPRWGYHGRHYYRGYDRGYGGYGRGYDGDGG